MTLIEKLNGILESSVFDESAQRHSVILQEKTAHMEVEVVADVSDVAIVDIQVIGHISKLRQGIGVDRRCDYLLIAKVDERHLFFLIELKKTINDKKEAKEQLFRSLPICRYLASICEVHYECPVVDFDVLYILIGEKLNERLDKQSIRPKKTCLVEIEEWRSIKIRKYLGPRILLSELAASALSVPVIRT